MTITKIFLLGFLLLPFPVAGLAQKSTPKVGLIKKDNAGKWVMYSDISNIPSTQKIFILGIHGDVAVRCCASINAHPSDLGDGASIFINVNSDKNHHLFTYALNIPKDLLLDSGSASLAVWNVGSVKKAGKGYLLLSKSIYRVDSCLSFEGVNFYIRDEQSNKEVAHYYWSLGYDVEGSDCRGLP